jgi:TRAP transporter TAXI family solute receptor
VAACTGALLLSSAAGAQTVVMATDKIGTILNAGASGMASIVSKYASTHIVTSTYGGQDLYVVAMDKGEVDLAPISAFGAWLNFTGQNPSKTKFRNMRILRASAGGLLQTYVTLQSTGIETIAGLKGKRVATDFLATPLLQLSTTASLSAAGLSLNDITKVPVSGISDAIAALSAGRVDATWTAFGIPAVQEVNANSPVRYLPIPASPEAMTILRRLLYPGARVTQVAPNPRLFLSKTTPMVDYDIYLIARADLPSEKVRPVLETLWDHSDELVKIHPILRTFVKEGAVTDLAVLPYHHEAIAFYKSKGLWTAEMQNNQEKYEARAKQ